MKGLHEILATKVWMIDPAAGEAFRKTIEQNLNAHTLLEGTHSVIAKVMRKNQEGKYHASHMMYDDDEVWDSDQDATEEDDNHYVCCIWVDGPVTRNGAGCSYGSKDHRDIILQCVGEEECEGILFYLNTPGGSSAAIPDYRYAIDKAREAGLPVLAFVDGMCASAGMYIAALCDERYYMNPRDEVGSIGVYGAWYSLKDGEKNYCGETYHEIYDPESYDKNKWYRDAMDGDIKLVLDDLKKEGVRFRADVKAACPNAKEEHLHGKMFPCSEVDGILVDGQKAFVECLQRIDELFWEKKRNSSSSAADNAANSDAGKDGGSDSPSSASSPTRKMSDFGIINFANMDKKYQTIAALCGVQELHATEEGVFLNAPLVDNMIANLKQARDAQETKVSAEKDNGQKALDAQKAEYEKQLADLKGQLDAKDKDLQALKAEIDEKQKAIDNHAADIKAKDATIAERNQTIEDLQAQVAQLNAAPGAEPEAGASPANNGAGVQDEGFTCEAPQYDCNLSPVENKKRFDEYEAKLKAEAFGAK